MLALLASSFFSALLTELKIKRHYSLTVVSFLILIAALPALGQFNQINDIDSVLKVAASKKLSEKRQWQKLLHFEPQMWGLKTYSQIDSQNFFLSAQGSTNLEAELTANIQAMWKAPKSPEEQIPQCLFPARYQFIKKHLAPEITEFPDRSCPRFEKYLKALQGNSASLVFSSFYLNNPSSAFGHTFIRINKQTAADGKRYELLDYGLNYAAEADTGNALFYAIKGLFGFFPGRFTSVPYYYKVREYSHAEARDLWEYELNINEEAVKMMISHIWELGPAYIDYWYLTENCSYHMFTLLEAADPNIDLISKVKKWVIPSDTVKDAWNSEGLVKNFTYRPSVRTEFFHRLKNFSEEEQIELKQIIENKQIPKNFSDKSELARRDLLDASIDYMDYKFAKEVQTDGWQKDFKSKLLVARSEIALATPPLKLTPPENELPHMGHGSRRLGLGYLGSKLGDDSYLFNIKHALHDRVDLITGYPEYAAITFGDFQFSYSRLRERIELEDFTLFEVLSFSPLSMFNQSLSWRIKVGAEKIKDENCINCHGAVLSGGAGYTFSLYDESRFTLFTGLRGGVYYVPTLQKNDFISGLGPSAEFRFRWTDSFVSTLEGWHRYNFEGSVRDYLEVNLKTQYAMNKNWALQFSGTELRYDQKAMFQIFYFY